MQDISVTDCKNVFGGAGTCVCTPLSTIWPMSTIYREDKPSATECRIWCCHEKKNHHWVFQANGVQNVEGDCNDGWKKKLDGVFGGVFT